MTEQRDDLRELEQAVAQLRHAYQNAVNGTIGNQLAYAHGLLGPQIEVLERHLRALAAAQETPQDRPQPIEDASGDRPQPLRRDLARLLDNLYGLHFRPGHLQAVLEVIDAHAPTKVPLAHGTPAARPAEDIIAELLNCSCEWESTMVRRDPACEMHQPAPPVGDRDATCDWNCVLPYPHSGPCSAVAEPPRAPHATKLYGHPVRPDESLPCDEFRIEPSAPVVKTCDSVEDRAARRPYVRGVMARE